MIEEFGMTNPPWDSNTCTPVFSISLNLTCVCNIASLRGMTSGLLVAFTFKNEEEFRFNLNPLMMQHRNIRGNLYFMKSFRFILKIRPYICLKDLMVSCGVVKAILIFRLQKERSIRL